MPKMNTLISREEKTDRMTFQEYCSELFKSRPSFNNRRGQYAFNLLQEVRPKLANDIRGTEIDPFHHREIPDSFLLHIGEYWDSSD